MFAYNGERPRFEVPDFPYPDSELMMNVSVVPANPPTDPWVISCNTPDMQHIKALHGITFEQEDPHDSVEWTDHSMLYDFKGRHAKGEPIEYRIGIFGNNIFYQSGTIEGRWFGAITPFGLPRPGQTRVFAIIAARKDEGDEASTAAFLRAVTQLEIDVVSEDIPIINTIHFRPGHADPQRHARWRDFSSTCATTRAAIRRRNSSPDREIGLLLFSPAPGTSSGFISCEAASCAIADRIG